MSDVDLERVRAVFLAARDLDHAGRRDVLRRACATDPALRLEVESLLVHHDSERRRLTMPLVGSVVEIMTGSTMPAPAALPRAFGGFELLEVIGRGGMGTVYRARQHTPGRTVALKVIHPGMMSAKMLGRFQFEVEVLARLQHPGIAQIFEAGAVESGGVEQPYFALELVTGEPIDRFVVTAGLDARQRLEILGRVCDAVHHAHQKGVIHRDLKPANILVDGSGQPKVLDFGVARATDADLRATTIRTNAGQLIGTLPYMSPEQVSGDPGQLDVRSDVYTLGVLLHEVLAGQLPYDLDGKTIPDAALVIRDGEPAPLGAKTPALRGDLETIARKALEKNPSRRYHSAAALGDDLRRYLAHQPIIARPPSVSHHVRLFARRHRALVAGGAIGAAALVVATAISVGFGLDALRAADREAKQRKIAERTNEFLEGILALPDPHREGTTLTVVEMLDEMITRLDNERELPEVEARVRGAIGKTYLRLRRAHTAEVQLGQAAELWRGLTPAGPDLAHTLVPLARARLQLGNGEGAEAAYREAVTILEATGEADLASVRSNLLSMLVGLRKFEEAKPIARALLEAAPPDNHLARIARLRQLARIDAGLGARDEAERGLSEAASLTAMHLPAAHPMHTGVALDLGVLRHAQGDLEGALEASTAAYDHSRSFLGIGSFDWMSVTNARLTILLAMNRRGEIVEMLTSSRDALLAAEGPDSRLAREIAGMLALLYDQWGEPEEATAIREAGDSITFTGRPRPTGTTTRPR